MQGERVACHLVIQWHCSSACSPASQTFVMEIAKAAIDDMINGIEDFKTRSQTRCAVNILGPPTPFSPVYGGSGRGRYRREVLIPLMTIPTYFKSSFLDSNSFIFKVLFYHHPTLPFRLETNYNCHRSLNSF